jgi:hypothetical protein
MTSFLWVSKEQATATAKCGGLSAAQQTMRLSLASVEMTPFRQGGRKAAKATHEACFDCENRQLKGGGGKKQATANATAGSFDLTQERLFDCAVRKVRELLRSG